MKTKLARVVMCRRGLDMKVGLGGYEILGSSPKQGPFQVPNIVGHPYNKDPKRDPNLENYPEDSVAMHTMGGYC